MPSLRRIAVLGVILLGYIWQVERVQPVHFFGQFQDDSIYFSTARSIAEGHGYRLESFPGRPYQSKYPILYPWLLSYVWKVSPGFPHNLNGAVHLTEFFGCWTLIAVFCLLSKLPGLGETAALWLTAITAFQPVFLRAGGLIMSDVPFMACMVTVLLLCVIACRKPANPWICLAIGALAGLATGIRTVGFSLVAGVCCALLVQKKFRPALFVAAAAGLAIALVLGPGLLHREPPANLAPGEPGWNQVVAYYTSYTQFQWTMGIPSLTGLARLVFLNLLVLASSPGLVIVGRFGKVLAFGAMILSIPMWIGLIRRWRTPEWTPVALTVLFYCGVVLVWPYPQPERFLLPFVPFFLAGLCCELQRIGPKIMERFRTESPRAERALAALLASSFLLLVAMAAWNAGVRDPRARRAGSAVQAEVLEEREQAYRWIQEHTSREDRVVSWKDVVLYLYTGRQGLRPVATLPQAIYLDDPKSVERDADRMCEAARHIGARYWMTTPDDFNLEPNRERLSRRMNEVAAVLPVVFRSPRGLVQIHDASCLNEQQRADCQAIRSVLFPR